MNFVGLLLYIRLQAVDGLLTLTLNNCLRGTTSGSERNGIKKNTIVLAQSLQ